MDATTTQLYIGILEKTNQQLNLISNPYAWVTGVLSFLVAFLAIAAAFILYRQSREYRELYQKALKDYETALQENLKKLGLDFEQKISSFIELKTKEVDAFSGDTKKKAKEIIKDLEREKDSIGSRIQFSTIENNRYQPFSLIDSGKAGIFGDTGRINFFTGYCRQCGTYNGINNITVMAPKYCSNCGGKL